MKSLLCTSIKWLQLVFHQCQSIKGRDEVPGLEIVHCPVLRQAYFLYMRQSKEKITGCDAWKPCLWIL